MKKLFIFSVLLFIGFTSMAQTFEVQESKKALLFKSTANWCSPCGTYHYITDSIYHHHSDSVLFLNGHVATSSVGDPHSGDMHNLLNGGGGIPAFSVSGHHLDEMWPPDFDQIMDYARNTFYASAVSANVAFNYSISGNTISVSTTTKIFEDFDMDNLYVGAMVVENNITVNQKVGEEWEDQLQHRIQRTVLGDLISVGESGKLWADEIATGSVSAGDFFDHTLTGTLDPSWDVDELEVIVVVWARNGDAFAALSSEDVVSPPANAYEIAFNVTDAGTSSPINNASITINGASINTNSSGQASTFLTDGDYDWTATATDYEEETGSMTVSGAGQTIDIQLEPASVQTYEVIYSVADGNGTITASVNGTSIESGDMVAAESTVQFTATPEESYLIYDWIYNGNPLGATEMVYAIESLDEDANVQVSFQPDGIETLDKGIAHIYPNPTKGKVIIKVDGLYELNILNLMGELVYHGFVSNKQTINLVDLPKGMYFLKLQKQNKIVHQSLIVN